MTARSKDLSSEDALRAYAVMMNTGEVGALEPLLADDFHYASQWVFDEIETKDAYVRYIKSKLAAATAAGQFVWAELAHLDFELPGPCVVLAQGQRDNLVALVLAKVEAGKLVRLDMCCVPSPHSARRSGEYPGR